MADDVDPRFAPEFQRGYNPAVHHRRTRHSPSVERSAGTVPPPSNTAPPRLDAEVDADDALPTMTPRRNPFLIALPVLAVVMLGACALFLVRWTDAYAQQMGPSNRNSESDWLMVGSVAMPAFLVGGLLCVTLWLTLLAIAPGRADD